MIALDFKSPERLEASFTNAAVLLIPPIGSRTTSDGGRDGQDLANRTGITVAVLDIPGGENFRRDEELRAKINDDYTAVIAEEFAFAAEEFEDREIHRILGIGRSAGGLALMGLVRSEILPIEGFRAYEPPALIGFRDTNDAKDYYSSYLERQKFRLNNPLEYGLVKPEKTDQRGMAYVRRGVSIVLNHFSLTYHHEELWASDYGSKLALDIARNMPEVWGEIVVAEDSMALANAEDKDKLAKELESARSSCGSGCQPMRLSVIKNTVHASFDLRPLIAEDTIQIAGELWSEAA